MHGIKLCKCEQYQQPQLFKELTFGQIDIQNNNFWKYEF